MIRVEGYTRGRELLRRRDSLESLVASPQLARQIERVFGEELSPEEVVKRVIADVRSRGDEALFDYAVRLDGVELSSLEVGRNEVATAYDMATKELISALELAASRIRGFHLACGCKSSTVFLTQHLGRKVQPLARVGLYIPGGTAAYPSTVLMTAIPARVAGVGETVVLSPAGKSGSIPPPTLVAADIAGVDRIFKVGGAQAIAALAFGTESIPRVDKICGPGNVFVTLAKKMLYGTVAIDGLEGPTEIVIVADESANASFCAADLLAQAEHDPMASAILITTSAQLADEINEAVERGLSGLERRSIASDAISRGVVVTVDNVDEAIDLVNLYAPEHLSLMVADPSPLVARIRNAGCIFVGENSPVVLGDYVAGPSHVLPTGGAARAGSPLGVEDFLKTSNIVSLDEAAMLELSQAAITIARTEGLDAHARAIELRMRGEAKKPS